MPTSINTYEAIKSYLNVRSRSSGGLQNLDNLSQDLQENYRFWQQQDSEIKTLLQITDLSRSSDSQKLKNKILETFQAYKIYFEAKFQDNSDIEKILNSFTDRGNFFKSIAPSEAEYANIVELMRGLNSYLLNLILPLTEEGLEESKKEEIKQSILSSLIEFPGKNGDNEFACIAGTRERISLASLASSNLLLHQKVIAEKLEEKSTILSPNIDLSYRAHLPSSLLYSLSFLTDEDAKKLDQHYKIPQCDTSLFDVIEMLKRFKSESKLILEKRIQDIIDGYGRFLGKLSKLEEIPTETTKLRETIQELLAATVDQDKITLLENIKSNIDSGFLKSLADLFPAEINFRELERLLELQSGNHYGQGQIRQVTEKLESILQKFSKLTEDQYKLRLLSDFQQKVQMEIDRDLLESTYDFFPTKKEEENDDDYGYGYGISSEKLKPSEELKLYFEEHLHKKYPQLYFLGDQGSECFKYLGDLDLFYDQGCTNLLDPKKISNLLSLFETIALSDSAEVIKIKKDKITAGILVLKNLCQNFKDSNDIYLLVFFDEFQQTKETDFDSFFSKIFDSDQDLSRLLSPIFESIKTKRESLSSSYDDDELDILKQIFLYEEQEFQFQEQRGQQQINIESLKFNVNQKFGRQQRNIFYFLVMNGQVGLISKIIDEKLDLFFAEDNIRLSPFDYAIKSNNLKVLEIIFDKIFSNRESIPLLEDLGTGPLSLASTHGHPKITEFLIKKYLEKESFNLLNQRLTANSPLIIAIKRGFDEVAKILINYQLGQEDLDESQNNALHNAILIGNTEIAKLLISKYSNLINLQDNQGNTPLHLASYHGHVEVVKELLGKRVNVNIQNNEGYTALHAASYQGHVDVVKLLLERGARVDIQSNIGNTALILASENGHVDVVKLLLERGARVDIQSNIGNTALILASEKGRVDVVRLLLERGAEVDIQNTIRDNALILASCYGHAEVVRLLLDKTRVDIKDDYGYNALHFASQNGHVEVVKLLLERGAEVNGLNNNGNTALILASYKGHVEVVKALLIAGANTEIINNSRQTALDIATRYERTEIIRLLTSHQSLSRNFKNKIRNGQFALAKDLLLQWETFDQSILTDRALKTNFTEFVFDVVRKNETDLVRTLIEKLGAKFFDLQDENKTTALMVASENGHVDVVKLLLERGAGVDIQNHDLDTALILASEKGRVDVVRLLLERGARVDIQNTDRDTALILASEKGHFEVVRLLLERGARVDIQNTDRDTALILASEKGHFEVVRLLLERGAGADIQSNKGYTALILASYQGYVKVVKLLLDKGAEVNTINKDCNTALHFASEKGHVEVVNALLGKEAGVDIKSDKNGDTALHRASQNGHVEVVKALLIAGANTEIINNSRQTALDIATRYERTEIIRLLTSHQSLSRNFKNKIRNGQFALAKDLLLQWETFDQSILTDRALKTNFTEFVFDVVRKNETDLVRTLIEKLGAKFFDLQDENKTTALMVASENGHVDVVKLLLERGARVDIQNNRDNTALILASYKGHVEVVKLLLERGARVDIQNTNRDTALILASYKGHVEVVRLLLERRAGADIQSNRVYTALILASYQGHVEVVKLLLDKGAEVNTINKDRNTPLILASYQGHVEVVKLLLDKEPKVDAKDNYGNTALHFASEKGHVEVVNELLDKKAGVDIKSDKNGDTALHRASQNGHVGVVEALLIAGANIKIINDSRQTALDIATRYERTEIIRLLTSHQSLSTDFKNKICNGQFALAKDLLLQWETFDQSILTDRALKTNFTEFVFDVVRKNETDLVRTLIEKLGAKFFDLRDGNEATALIIACQSGNTEVASLLIEKSKSNSENYTNFADENGYTALHYASAISNAEVVKALLRGGAGVDAKNHDSYTALHYASYHGNVEIVKALLIGGAGVDAKNHDGYTALILASSNGRVEVVEALLVAAVNDEARNNLRQTAFRKAIEHRKFELAEILLLQSKTFDQSILTDSELKTNFTEFVFDAVRNNKTDLVTTLIEKLEAKKFFDLRYKNEATALMVASKKGCADVVELLLDKGAKIDDKNSNGDNSLHLASKKGHVKVVRLLLDKGAKIDDKNSNGDNSLHLASKKGHVEVVRLLLDKGAGVNDKNSNGDTALHLASSKEDNSEVFKVLLKRGAKVNDQNNDGNTPLHLASRHGFDKSAKLLLENRADVNSTNKGGNTPLHFAAANGHVEVFILFLKKGADHEIKNYQGKEAVGMATQDRKNEIVQSLNNHKELLKSSRDLIKEILFTLTDKSPSDQNLLRKLESSDVINDQELETNLTEFVFDAVRNNKTDLVTTLIEKLGAKFFDLRDENEATALIITCQSGNTEVASLLMEQSKSIPEGYIDLCDKDALASIHYASSKGYVKIVELLLKNGAKVDIRNSGGTEAIHFASYHGHSEVVKLLLKNGARVDSENSHSDTPLHYACSNSHNEVVKLLLENGANTEIKNNLGQTALDIVSQAKNTEIVELIASTGFRKLIVKDRLAERSIALDQLTLTDTESREKVTRLVFEAVQDNQTYLVEALIEKLGADFFKLIYEGDNIIEYAILSYQGETDGLIKILLKKFKELVPNEIVDEGKEYTPFHYISYTGKDKKEIASLALIKILCESGFNINAKSSSGKTVLHYVVSTFSSNPSEIIELLIQKGVEVDEKARSGDTALHMAVQEGNLEAIETLLKNGASHNVENNANHTPLKLAESKGNYNKIKKIFDKYVPSVDPANPESPRGIVDNGRERP